MSVEKNWDDFLSHYQKLATVRGVHSLLDWDMQTLIPKDAIEQRGEQNAYIEAHLHELVTDPRYRDALESLDREGSRLPPDRRAAVRRELKSARREKKVPVALVEGLAHAKVKAHQSWAQARKESRFELFSPDLKRIVELTKAYAKCIREEGQPEYEAMLDLFEPDFPLKQYQALLGGMKSELLRLGPMIIEKHQKMKLRAGAATQSAHGVPVAKQAELNMRILELMGFDFSRGRMDVSVHPFCSGSGKDIRLTTRYLENDWAYSFFSVLHEGGHGLYEQGMEKGVTLKPLRQSPGMGMHESQSRLWENAIGRSRAFCELVFERFGAVLGPAAGRNADELFDSVNRVRPSYIRTESDEVTYNLHILLRFELEAALFDGSLTVDDLPGAWWDRMKQGLGLPPVKDSDGVLQDIHWSMGAFGYFPTYSIGNLIAAQLGETLSQELNVDDLIRAGKLTEVRDWLNERVHRHGQELTTLELVRQSTGRELTHEAHARYLERKFLA